MRSPRKPGLAKFIWFGMGQFMMNAYINAYDWLKVSKRIIMFSCILGRGLVSKIFGYFIILFIDGVAQSAK